MAEKSMDMLKEQLTALNGEKDLFKIQEIKKTISNLVGANTKFVVYDDNQKIIVDTTIAILTQILSGTKIGNSFRVGENVISLYSINEIPSTEIALSPFSLKPLVNYDGGSYCPITGINVAKLSKTAIAFINYLVNVRNVILEPHIISKIKNFTLGIPKTTFDERELYLIYPALYADWKKAAKNSVAEPPVSTETSVPSVITDDDIITDYDDDLL